MSKKAYFWTIGALEASNRSQITFCILTNVLNSIPERFGPIFEQIKQINISLTATANTMACILIYHCDNALSMAYQLGFYCYTDSLTHSLRRIAA